MLVASSSTATRPPGRAPQKADTPIGHALNLPSPPPSQTRLAKFYVPLSDAEQRAAEVDVFRATAGRDARTSANVLDWGAHKLVARRYAGLAFAACIDAADCELAALEAIHLFVEVLDHYFGAVCELDLVFNFHKVRGMREKRDGMGRVCAGWARLSLSPSPISLIRPTSSWTSSSWAARSRRRARRW